MSECVLVCPAHSQVFGFLEELLSTRFPYSSYKLVFVDQTYRDTASYSTLTICKCVRCSMYVCVYVVVYVYVFLCVFIMCCVWYMCTSVSVLTFLPGTHTHTHIHTT